MYNHMYLYIYIYIYDYITNIFLQPTKKKGNKTTSRKKKSSTAPRAGCRNHIQRRIPGIESHRLGDRSSCFHGFRESNFLFFTWKDVLFGEKLEELATTIQRQLCKPMRGNTLQGRVGSSNGSFLSCP